MPVDHDHFFYGKHPDIVLLLERPNSSGRAVKQTTFLPPPGVDGAEAHLYRDLRAGHASPEDALDLAVRLAAGR